MISIGFGLILRRVWCINSLNQSSLLFNSLSLKWLTSIVASLTFIAREFRSVEFLPKFGPYYDFNCCKIFNQRKFILSELLLSCSELKQSL